MIRPTLKFHLGAHKTATTHFQQTLEAMQISLNQDNIHYEPLSVTRKKVSKLRRHVKRNPYFLLSSPTKRQQTVCDKLIDPEYNHIEIFLRSEENILGRAVDACDTSLYRHSDTRLRFLTYVTQQFDTHMYVSIRHFADVFIGAYITALRFNPHYAIHAKKRLLKQLSDGATVSWLPLLENINKFSDLPLTVWSQEYYKSHCTKIIKHFIGRDDIDIPSIKPPTCTKTPSYKAIEHIERQFKKHYRQPKDWLQICDSVYAEYPATEQDEKYCFINEQLHSRLSQCYENDKRLLNANNAIVMLDQALS
jgi:hypothetical protein